MDLLNTPSSTRSRRSQTPSVSSMCTAESSDSIPDTGAGSTTAIIDNLNDEAAVGLADPSSTGSRRAMLQLINRLRDTGVQTDIDLPMIAVIGNQSAGKSSLIESICGVTLPRSSGTCTRCPTECKISQSDSPWKCIVKLHFSTDSKGVPIPVKNVPFGAPITSRSQVEDRIRRAQRAILNPSKKLNTYLQEDDLPDDNEVSFSKNYVSLEISGSGLTDLSFVDLPGLIASAGRGSDGRDIELVKSLVTSYIEKPSCVILLTVACETDFENQGAHTLAKEYDPDGKRTVGVLTKPDRIPPGDEPEWIKILRNETEPLVNNWYCVKQPSSQDVARGITYLEARRRENEWFASTPPWSSLEPQYQRFLRTSYLTERLSLILSELIAKRLPKIQEELMNAIQGTQEKLQALPKPPSSDPVGEVLQTLRNFERDLEHRVEGTPEEDGLLQTILPCQEAFKISIRRTAPQFVPWEETSAKELPEPAFLSNEHENHAAMVSDAGQNNIYVNDVLKRAQNARTRELPDNYPFVVQRAYIKEITQKWSTPAMIFFEDVYAILKDDLVNLVDAHFAHMGNGNAKRAIQMIVNDHLDEAAIRTKDRIQWLLELEQNPTTLNTHYYANYRDKFLAYYKAALDDSDLLTKIQQGRSPTINGILSGLNDLGISATLTDLPKLLPADPKDAALTIMASVRAYFQVAYKRFVDMVPMTIDHEIVLGIQKGIYRALQEGLQITGPEGQDRCKSMLEERIGVVTLRQETQDKMQRLQAARQELRRLM
ncbi:P-loop containing nucleoside triphosphate hydrolase protein [Boletus edulis BED1]|uniref:P-loop containing nucleoside triphosphate hydrolase protein n=1 Tax=Boletus edulis BED1 TaxID=1328754 RepID=A0AAD4BM46_BOLED|nr:P-loop containing nucleoside triphosphate hydrolase protein [Boletus edulis BED1]